MANIDKPRGFKLYQSEGKCLKTREYEKTAAAVINEGDLVMRVPAGTIEVYVAGTLPAAGIVVGVAAQSSSATDTDKIPVYDDAEASFVVQSADAYAVADNGLNVDIAAAPVAVDGRSGQEIDMATKATTATLPLKVIELAPRINQEENSAGVNADIIVKLNSVERGAGQAGI